MLRVIQYRKCRWRNIAVNSQKYNEIARYIFPLLVLIITMNNRDRLGHHALAKALGSVADRGTEHTIIDIIFLLQYVVPVLPCLKPYSFNDSNQQIKNCKCSCCCVQNALRAARLGLYAAAAPCQKAPSCAPAFKNRNHWCLTAAQLLLFSADLAHTPYT